MAILRWGEVALCNPAPWADDGIRTCLFPSDGIWKALAWPVGPGNLGGTFTFHSASVECIDAA